MSWFKDEMKAFWFSCRHPFGIDDVIMSDTSPTLKQSIAIRNLIELSKERLEISKPGKNGKPKPVDIMAPSTEALAQSCIALIESYARELPGHEEKDIS
mgnify:FL=1